MRMSKRAASARVAASAIAMVVALVVPGAASAQTDDYTSPSPSLAAGGSNNSPGVLSGSQTLRVESDNLPFTGADILQFTVIGMSALGAGFALRRRSRRIA